MNASFIHVKGQAQTSAEETRSILPVSNINMKIEINATQSVYNLPCEFTLYALGNVYSSSEFCDDWSFNPQVPS